MGGLFGGLNTLYAAFAARFREIGMLQSLGYSRGAVALSLIQESVLIALTGALGAALMGLVLLDGAAVKISMGAFGLVLDAKTLGAGLGRPLARSRGGDADRKGFCWFASLSGGDSLSDFLRQSEAGPEQVEV